MAVTNVQEPDMEEALIDCWSIGIGNKLPGEQAASTLSQHSQCAVIPRFQQTPVNILVRKQQYYRKFKYWLG